MKSLAAFVFDGFQTLDLFGPIEMLGDVGDELDITIVAKTMDPVVSTHGQRISADKTIFDGHTYDLLLVPGGQGALANTKDSEVVQWLTEVSNEAELVMAVCTGCILLAATGLLDGRKATTNKQLFAGTTPLAPRVEWVPQARWVEDGKFFTSSGVSAGMDMALAAISRTFDQKTAEHIARHTEYDWHRDADWDPFAKLYGLA